jgi:riboflavin kinase/FMN adenylyltransferase
LIAAMDRDSRKARAAIAAAKPIDDLDTRLGFL